jgi:hypothetical protein
MATIQMNSGGFGGVVQGNYGTYQAASDGTFTVDTRDASTLLSIGFTYLNKNTNAYTTPKAPAAASATAIVASGALSNGTVAVTANPDVLRQVNLIIGAGTTAISAGTLAVTYIGNDGIPGTDTLSLVCAASGTVTQFLTRGVDTISSIVVAGLTGGASPFLEMGTTTTISVPVGPSTVDVLFEREFDSSATIAVGTASSVTLASIAPTTAPNGTITYSFVYSYVTPDV